VRAREVIDRARDVAELLGDVGRHRVAPHLREHVEGRPCAVLARAERREQLRDLRCVVDLDRVAQCAGQVTAGLGRAECALEVPELLEQIRRPRVLPGLRGEPRSLEMFPGCE
jgi:hypothetical protein